MDDYLSLYEHNATLFNFEDEVNRDVNHITKNFLGKIYKSSLITHKYLLTKYF